MRVVLAAVILWLLLFIVWLPGALAQPIFPHDFRPLSFWTFNDTNCTSPRGDLPRSLFGSDTVESWNGTALRAEGTTGLLNYNEIEPTGRTNILCDNGSVRFWFRPSWNSANNGGTGPGTFARLIEMGAYTPGASVGWWSLYLDEGGTNIYFAAQTNGAGATYLSAPIQWTSNWWYLITLAYSPSNSALYLDDQLATNGSGVAYWPSAAVRTNGFAVGSDLSGTNLANGYFENLRTWAEPVDMDETADFYAFMIEFDDPNSGDEGGLAPEGFGAELLPDNPLSGGCTALTLKATLLTSNRVQLDICGKEANAKYDLIYKTNLSSASWQWIMELAPADNAVMVFTTNFPMRFFQLKKVPDIDGDGLRDFWEWGGTSPFTIDDDRDNDGIPDSIEISSGSATNDPTSLPPPSIYVSAGAPSGADGSLDLPFSDIQTAINAATNFSVILVKSGTYTGVSNRNLNSGGKKLVLISEKGWESTIIDCEGLITYAFAFNSPTQDYHLQINGFTITNGNFRRSVVSCTATSAPTFVNCQFIGNAGSAVVCTNASPVFVNCRFLTNSFGGSVAAIYATGAGSKVRFSHCTINDNVRTNNAGQIYATNSATISLNNTIVWGVNTNSGAEVATGGSGAVTASYCDVRGGYTGSGNINSDPLFDNIVSSRLTVNSPCIDQGVADNIPGFALFTRYDMDGEQRLDHAGFANPYNIVDIGADEYVYRLQFPTVAGIKWAIGTNGYYLAETNQFSEVGEASGAVFLGTNATGPLMAIVDDEARTNFHIYQLNADASAISKSVSISLLNTNFSGSQQEIGDMEGITFDAATRKLYLITSQTKRNRYRDVDSSPPILDPVIDPPSNDYDRRRGILATIQLDSSLTNATNVAFFQPEAVVAPYNTDYEPTNGLAAHLRKQFTNNVALGDTNRGNKVMIAWNTANKFGTPKNGVSYTNGALLPYVNGGPSNAAATSLGIINPGGASGTNNHTGRTAGAVYFYKIWAVDAQTNYMEGLTVGVTNNGIPSIYINEFDVAGGNETIEFYNPSPVAVSLVHCYLSSDTRFPNVGNYIRLSNSVTYTPTVPGRGVWAFNISANVNWRFEDDVGTNNIVLAWTDTVTRMDEWNYGRQNGGVTEGRVWDGGSRGFISVATTNGDFESCKYDSTLIPPSPYTTNLGALNHSAPHKYFDVVPDVSQTNIYLLWQNMGVVPAVWKYSPKQHDFHALNIEDIAFRNANEMIFGLRAPLVNRTTGNAYFFVATNLSAFLPASGWTNGSLQGIDGPLQMNLGGLGIRSIKWCPTGLTNSAGVTVARYLILAGNANGGPLQRESLRQKFQVYAWDSTTTGGVATPQLLVSDVQGYAIRPEGVDMINAQGEWRVLFVEDRFQSAGSGTRNAIHWPVSILGSVQ